jgi:AbrB family looped-hinge helix DNA binding protein
MDIVKLSTKGQLVIPKSLRNELSIDEDTQLAITRIGDQIVIKKVDTDKIRQDIEEFWKIRRKTPKMSSEEIDRAIREYRAKSSARH